MQHLSFQHGHLQGRNSAAHYAEGPRIDGDHGSRCCDNARPGGNDDGAAQRKLVNAARRSNVVKHLRGPNGSNHDAPRCGFVKAARRSSVIGYVQRLDKTEPHGSYQRLRDLPQRRRRDRQAVEPRRHQRALRDLPQERRNVRRSPDEPYGARRELRQMS